MAGTIRANFSGSVVNGSFNHTLPSVALSAVQTTLGAHCPIVTVGTSEEDLATGDVGTLGYLFLRNLDDTNYVQWGAEDTTMKTVGRLMPGAFAWFQLEPGITLRWVANTAPVKVEVRLFEL